MSVKELFNFLRLPLCACGLAPLESDHSAGRIQRTKGFRVDVYPFTRRHDVTYYMAMGKGGDVRLKKAQVDKTRPGFQAISAGLIAQGRVTPGVFPGKPGTMWRAMWRARQARMVIAHCLQTNGLSSSTFSPSQFVPLRTRVTQRSGAKYLWAGQDKKLSPTWGPDDGNHGNMERDLFEATGTRDHLFKSRSIVDISADHLKLDDQGLPIAPPDRDVVLHTRVVTETGGGPDKTILLSSPFLAHSNYWLAAAYMHPPEDKGFATVEERARSWNSPLISVPDRGPLDRKVLSKMLGLCKKYNVKIWHGHDYKSNLIGLMLRPFHKMKLVSTVHGWVKHTTKTPLYYAVDRWSLKWYHHVICVSEDLLDVVKDLKIPEDRYSLVHNAIDEKTFSRKHEAAVAPMRLEKGTPGQRLVIGAVGRLSAEKGFNLLIQAAAKLIREGHDIELWIAGDGDAKPELQKLIDHLKVADRVKLLGFVSDTLALYHAMDLFVLSSLREGLPNVVLESMAMRVPVVSTKVAGVPKMISDGVNGLLVDIGDVDLLTDAMRKAVTDESLRRRMTDEGRALIERQYSFTRRMEKIQAIYDRVLGAVKAGKRESEKAENSEGARALPLSKV